MDLYKLKRPELNQLAKEKGLKGFSKMKKPELVKALGGPSPKRKRSRKNTNIDNPYMIFANKNRDAVKKDLEKEGLTGRDLFVAVGKRLGKLYREKFGKKSPSKSSRSPKRRTPKKTTPKRTPKKTSRSPKRRSPKKTTPKRSPKKGKKSSRSPKQVKKAKK